MSYRVLVTGSRTWDDEARIHAVLDGLATGIEDELVLVHGACPKGADAIADAWAEKFGVKVERFPADWPTHGRSAGHKRNQEMIDTKPDEVLAFIRDASPGATGCVQAAKRAGLSVRVFDYEHETAEQSYGLGYEARVDAATPSLVSADAPATPQSPPPSTVRELRGVLIDFEASRPRSMQVELGPSELGTPCDQQMGRKLAGAPRQPILAPTWAPFQGTAVHRSMEDVVAHWNKLLGRERWLAEDRLTVYPGEPGIDPIEGNGDAFDTDWDTVVDWKHVGKTALDKLRSARRAGKPPAEQVSPEYRIQGHLYGYGHARKGRPVRFVRLVLLARDYDYDRSEEWTEAYDPAIAETAIARYVANVRLLAELDVVREPQQIALIPAAPSPDTCKWCPFHRPDQPAGWASCSGAAGDNPGVTAMTRLRRQTLLNEIKAAPSVRVLERIWERANKAGTWTDEATDVAKARKAALLAAARPAA